MRAALLPVVLLFAACGVTARQPELSSEEQRLMEYIRRDPFVVVTSTERDSDGRLVVTTQQGRRERRYLLAPVSATDEHLRVRPLQDACVLDTAPNPTPGGRILR